MKIYDVKTVGRNKEDQQLCISFNSDNMYLLIPLRDINNEDCLLRYSLSLKELAEHIKPFMEDK